MPFTILVYNTDGTLNKNGFIKEFATLQLVINDYYKHCNGPRQAGQLKTAYAQDYKTYYIGF